MQSQAAIERIKIGRTNLTMIGGLALAVILAVAGYLVASSRLAGIGFPLDDAWIHQTYARNLAQYGEWAFIPGQPSAGSTAPLWSVLLALGYFLRLPYLAWTFLLGGLSLLGVAIAGEALARRYAPDCKGRFPWVGLFLVGEWHLVWASVSGMETLLFALFILLALAGSTRARGKGWGAVGLLLGLSVWVRPDGITLLGPAALTLLLVEPGWRERIKSLLWLSGGLALLFAPYLLFNLLVQGSVWPNTFYAKQAEYAALRQLPLLARFFNEVELPLIGSGMFLLPGFAAFVYRTARSAWRDRPWAASSSGDEGRLAPPAASSGALARLALPAASSGALARLAAPAAIWFFGYALLYALRLPVTYQYGRYFIPAMPVYFVLGLVGTVRLARDLRGRKIPWLLARVALLSGAAVWCAFYAIGAGRYAQDVQIIETQMVAAAKWTAANTPPNAVIAAHDIGAMGYFGQRRLLDLAGLVSPEVIPFIRDETRIARWLDGQHADYLVILSNWYRTLPDGKPLAFRTEGWPTIENGKPQEVFMAVYRWKP